MKSLKFIFLVILLSFSISSVYAHPRHRVVIYKTFPGQRVVKVVVIKKPHVVYKLHKRHIKKIIRYYY